MSPAWTCPGANISSTPTTASDVDSARRISAASELIAAPPERDR